MLVRRTLLSCSRVRRAAVQPKEPAEALPEKPQKERQARSEALYVLFNRFTGSGSSTSPAALAQKLGVYRWNNLGTSSFLEMALMFATCLGMGLFLWSMFSRMKYDVVTLERPKSEADREREAKKADKKNDTVKVASREPERRTEDRRQYNDDTTTPSPISLQKSA